MIMVLIIAGLLIGLGLLLVFKGFEGVFDVIGAIFEFIFDNFSKIIGIILIIIALSFAGLIFYYE